MEQNRKISCEANETELGVKVLGEASEGGEPRDAQSSNDNTEKYQLENEHQFCLNARTKTEGCKGESRAPECDEPHSDEEAATTPHSDDEAHYDRGWAWVVCATAALMEFFVGGLITSSGVIYAALIEDFDKSRVETGNVLCTI